MPKRDLHGLDVYPGMEDEVRPYSTSPSYYDDPRAHWDRYEDSWTFELRLIREK